MKKLFVIVTIFLLSTSVFAEKPIVKNIQAVCGTGRNVTIIWEKPDNSEITEFHIYRSTILISDFSQIKDIEPIAKINSSICSYKETLQDFNEYFYAVIAVTTSPYPIIIPSVNATTKGISLPKQPHQKIQKAQKEERLYMEGTSRDTPLPYLNIIENQEEKILLDSTIKIAKNLQKKDQKQKDELTPYFFEEDLVSPDGGDDYILFQILKTTFAPKNYEAAIKELNKLLGTNASENTLDRATFYLGQSQYMLGHFEDSVKTFVKVQTKYPSLTKKWIDAALEKI